MVYHKTHFTTLSGAFPLAMVYDDEKPGSGAVHGMRPDGSSVELARFGDGEEFYSAVDALEALRDD